MTQMNSLLALLVVTLVCVLCGVRAQQTDGLGGWHIMNTTQFKPTNPLDGIAFEWDYYTLADPAAQFTGIVCYVVMDPRGRLGNNASLPFDIKLNALPSGGNIAVVAAWGDGKKTAEYLPFGVSATVSSTSRTFDGKSADGSVWARQTPIRQAGGPDTMHLEGQTPEMAWDLYVIQGWPERYANIKPGDAFSPQSGVMDKVTGEEWTVDMLWPRTIITGTLTRRSTGQVVTLSADAGGYRENSFGHWAFPLGGWDFGVGSDVNTGVGFAVQTYYEFVTQKGELSGMDLSFYDQGKLVLRRFTLEKKQFGWNHVASGWHYDAQSAFCVPDGTTFVAQDSKYRVEASFRTKENQTALLYNTGLAKLFFIEEQFPWISGTIYDRTQKNRVVTTFSMQGGGEFSHLKSLLPIPVSRDVCAFFCNIVFQAPLPKK